MRWIILILLLISCSDNTEKEMIQFQANLQSGVLVPSFPTNGVRVFLLTGQSNAVGRGFNSDATTAELAAQPQFKIWSKINSQFEDLDVGTNNLNSWLDRHGIELGLAKNFNTYYPSETGYIIKWGVDGTPIIDHLSTGAVYLEFWNNYVKPGLNDLINAGKIPYVYLIYAQGEKDSNLNVSTIADLNLYGSRFDTLVSLWRSNLGINLPITPYEIHNPLPAGYDTTRIVNQVFADKAAIDSNLEVLQTEFLSSIGDDLHFSYASHKAASILAYDYFITKTGQPITTLIP